MANSLLDIKPHVVSRDLRGYSVLFYGAPKSGKTTTATKFPNSLLLGFEKGYNALPGVMARPINSWGDFKKVIRELQDEEVQKVFSTIIIDTGDIAYSYCEAYTCSLMEVDDLQEVGYGKGFSACAKEFDATIRKILTMNYGLIIISHAQDKTFKDAKGEEFNQIVPTLDKRGRLICERTCDIIGYSREVETEEGLETRLFMRGTPRFVAGSRFKYTPDSIVFNYQNLVDAIVDAIDIQVKEDGGNFVSEERGVNLHVSANEKLDFNQLMIEFQNTTKTLLESATTDAEKGEKTKLIINIVEGYLGKGKRVSDCTAGQVEQVDLIVYDLKKFI